MCGIAGAISRDDAPAGRDAVLRATRALVHRGPDEEGFFEASDGRVAFGHRRLSVIDVAGGQQPLYNEDRSVVLIYNGEIYNHEELRRDLVARGHRFATRADGEAIVHLYEDHGPRAVEKLRGMFAIALWDGRSRTLLLARDRLGKKPLVYGELPDGRLVFASELNALRAGWGHGELDVQALEAYLALGSVPAPWTIEARYRKLPPASRLVLEERRPPRIDRYWEPSALPKLDVSRTEALELLRGKLLEALELRLMSEVPLGVFLSGGVDSSVVLALMSEASRVPVRTFTIGFEDAVHDESAHAREAARAFGAEHHELVVRPDRLDLLERVLSQYGEPFADSSCLPTWVLAGLAREHVTVALTGDGGDELFGGYPRERWLLRLARLSALVPRALARFAAGLLPRLGRFRRSGRLFELLAQDGPGRALELMGVCGARLRRELLTAPAPHGGSAAEDHVGRALARADGGELDRLLGLELRTYLPDDLLVKTDIATMAHGLEARSPLLDHELVELVSRFPAEWKLDRGRPKALLKDAVAGKFRAGFLERPKQGFSVPLKRWIRDDVDGYFADELRHGELARSGLVRMDAVERLLAEERGGLANHQHRIFALVSLSLFLRRRG